MQGIPLSRRYRLRRAIKKLSGLVIYYPLDEVSGNIAKNNAPANLGTNNGVTTSATVGWQGRLGRAYKFVGASPRVNFTGFTRNAGQPMSVLAVFKPTLPTGGQSVIVGIRNGSGAGNLFKLYCPQNPGQGMGFQYDPTGSGGDPGSGSFVVSSDVWYMALGVYDGSNIILYVNGVQVGILTNKPNAAINQTLGAIGVRADNNTEPYTGYIQHAALFSRALSAAEVKRIAHIGGFI